MKEALDPVRVWLENGVQRLQDDLANGADVPPARRYRLEGAIECWARQRGMNTEELEQWLTQARLAGDVEAEAGSAQWRVRLQLPMRRAPVKPTTSD